MYRRERCHGWGKGGGTIGARAVAAAALRCSGTFRHELHWLAHAELVCSPPCAQPKQPSEGPARLARLPICLPGCPLPQMALLPAALNLAWVSVYYLVIFVLLNKRIQKRGYQNMCAGAAGRGCVLVADGAPRLSALALRPVRTCRRADAPHRSRLPPSSCSAGSRPW